MFQPFVKKSLAAFLGPRARYTRPRVDVKHKAPWLIALAAAQGCYEPAELGAAYELPGTSGMEETSLTDRTETDGDQGDSGLASTDTGDGDSTDGDADDDGNADADGDTDGDTEGEVPIDCTPMWETPWVGSPCEADGDCSFEGGQCLLPSDGFPCGTCTLPCTTTCPDIEDTPVTYCINGADVGVSDAGQCLSKCDTEILPGEGCRDGYVCDVLSRFDDGGVDSVCIPDALGTRGRYVEEIDHEFLIEFLGGDPVDALAFGPDPDSLQFYLDAVGVQYVSAAEIITPNNMGAALDCGLMILLPPQDQWEKIAALALFTDQLRELLGEPIIVRNWWRPPCYNAAVGGAPDGDHPDADAVDLDFTSRTSRSIAQAFLCEQYWAQDIVGPREIAPGSDLDPRLNMSVGLGAVTIHLGVLSAGGRRSWKYSSYSEEPESGECW